MLEKIQVILLGKISIRNSGSCLRNTHCPVILPSLAFTRTLEPIATPLQFFGCTIFEWFHDAKIKHFVLEIGIFYLFIFKFYLCFFSNAILIFNFSHSRTVFFLSRMNVQSSRETYREGRRETKRRDKKKSMNNNLQPLSSHI